MNKRKSLSKLVLLILEKTVDGYVTFQDLICNPGFYVYGMREVNKSALSNALKRLREGGFVELLSDKELTLRLTDAGRNKALRTKMIMEDGEWDGKWRLVVWDIPEKRRKARDLLRYQLKQFGFKQFQKSIWASKKNCTMLIREYIKKVGIEDWVQVLESNTLEI